jgi:hypothetical protein
VIASAAVIQAFFAGLLAGVAAVAFAVLAIIGALADHQRRTLDEIAGDGL